MRVPDFREARARLEQKDRSLRDKLVDLKQAASLVKDGDHIAIGGCLYSRTPFALLLEILRRRPKGLSLSRNLMCYEGELFLVAGAADRLMAAWMGIGLPWGLSKILRHYVETGKATFEEWSHLGIGLRYKAGAMGVPFLPMVSMLGSDLMRVGGAKTIKCPFTNETLCAVPAWFPDVAVLHVHRADRYGNAQIDGYTHMDVDQARAAARVIVTAEEIVDTEELRATSDRTIIPHFVVDAVVEVPFGAYPHECYGLYEADFDHFDDYVRRINERGVAGVEEYLDKYVYGMDSFEEFLESVGAKRLLRQQRRARELIAR